MRISDWSSDVCSSDLFSDRVAGRAFERSGKLARAVFFAGLPITCEVALLIDDKRIVRDRRACPAVVFGQIAPAAFCLDIEEARGAIVGYDRAGFVIIEPAEPVEMAVAHALNGVLGDEQRPRRIGVSAQEDERAAPAIGTEIGR